MMVRGRPGSSLGWLPDSIRLAVSSCSVLVVGLGVGGVGCVLGLGVCLCVWWMGLLPEGCCSALLVACSHEWIYEREFRPPPDPGPALFRITASKAYRYPAKISCRVICLT